MWDPEICQSAREGEKWRPVYYYTPPLAPRRFLQGRAARARAISQSVSSRRRLRAPARRARPRASRGLCSSIHPKRELFGSKQILSKYLRKLNKWVTDVSLGLHLRHARGRILGNFARRFVRQFGRGFAPLLEPLWHSARFACPETRIFNNLAHFPCLNIRN